MQKEKGLLHLSMEAERNIQEKGDFQKNNKRVSKKYWIINSLFCSFFSEFRL